MVQTETTRQNKPKYDSEGETSHGEINMNLNQKC